MLLWKLHPCRQRMQPGSYTHADRGCSQGTHPLLYKLNELLKADEPAAGMFSHINHLPFAFKAGRAALAQIPASKASLPKDGPCVVRDTASMAVELAG